MGMKESYVHFYRKAFVVKRLLLVFQSIIYFPEFPIIPPYTFVLGIFIMYLPYPHFL